MHLLTFVDFVVGQGWAGIFWRDPPRKFRYRKLDVEENSQTISITDRSLLFLIVLCYSAATGFNGKLIKFNTYPIIVRN